MSLTAISAPPTTAADHRGVGDGASARSRPRPDRGSRRVRGAWFWSARCFFVSDFGHAKSGKGRCYVDISTPMAIANFRPELACYVGEGRLVWMYLVEPSARSNCRPEIKIPHV